jgi:RNA polymerase sigma-70 factor (ECF subfamily)
VTERAPSDLSGIYEAYHGRVLAYAAKLLGRTEADDVAQDVFVKIGRSLESLEDPAKLTSWVYAITLNAVRDAARKRCRAPERHPPVPDPGSRTPEEAAIRAEMIACYLDYVKELPPTYHEVYVLSEFEDLSNEEIARRLSVSLGTVKIRLHRAREALNRQLRRNCQCYHNARGELMAAPRRS